MSSVVRLYGIKNCDTVQKSLRWLTEKSLSNDFFDLKKEALSSELITEWIDDVGLEKLINKRSLTWRKIDDESKKLEDQDAVIQLIQENPTVVKRPVMNNGASWSVGFKAEDWDKLF